MVLQLYPQNPLCGLGRGPERWGGARLAGWECAHCVSYAHERFFAEMTPVTMLQWGGPFLLSLLPIQLFLTLSHTQCSFPAPLPPQRKIALQTLALLPGKPVWPSLLPSLNPTFGEGQGAKQPLPSVWLQPSGPAPSLGEDRGRSL